MGLKCKHFLVKLVLLIAWLQKQLINSFPKARQNAFQEFNASSKNHPHKSYLSFQLYLPKAFLGHKKKI